MLIADHQTWVGSQNWSEPRLINNREVSLITANASIHGTVLACGARLTHSDERGVRSVIQPPTPPPNFYTMAEVAQMLRCSIRTVQNMIKQGRLPATIIGRNRYRVPRDALEAIIRPNK